MPKRKLLATVGEARPTGNVTTDDGSKSSFPVPIPNDVMDCIVKQSWFYKSNQTKCMAAED